MNVTVLRIRDMNAPEAKTTAALRAYADVKIGPIEIYRIPVIKPAGRSPYVLPPQIEYFDGKDVQCDPFIKWPEEWSKAILAAVWPAYEAQRKGANT